MMAEPLLSVVLCSRNDRYMGDSRWRLRTALDYLGERVADLGFADRVEVLVTDWGSDVPLHEVVTLRPAAAAITSFVVVPPDIARRRQRDSPFPEVLALNAAARRARGRFIGRIDQDILVGERFLRVFAEAAGDGSPRWDRALLFANRRGIPYRFAAQGPSFANVTRFVRLAGESLKIERHNRYTGNVYWTSYVGMWLAHRDLWHECGGYDERMIYYNWMEADMICRLRPRYPILDLGLLSGYDFYHLEHYHPRASLFARAHVRKNAAVDLRAAAPALHPNASSWGLSDEALVVEPARVASPESLAPPDHRNDEVNAFAQNMAALARDMVADRAVIYWAVQTRLWGRRWRRLSGRGRQPAEGHS